MISFIFEQEPKSNVSTSIGDLNLFENAFEKPVYLVLATLMPAALSVMSKAICLMPKRLQPAL